MSDAKKNQKSKPKNQRTKPYSVKQREKMFVYWCECDNLRETARKFKVSPNTLYKLKREHSWDDRRDQVIADAKKNSEKIATANVTTNVKNAQAILDLVTTKLLDDDSDIDADIGDFVKLAKYIDEFTGTAPVDPGMEMLIHAIKNYAKAGPDDQQRRVTNMLAGYGITDAATINRLSKVFLSVKHSRN